MTEQGTWPSLEWRLPPKQQDRGSNPRVPAIMHEFNTFSGNQGANSLIRGLYYAFDSSLISGFMTLTDDKQNIFI